MPLAADARAIVTGTGSAWTAYKRRAAPSVSASWRPTWAISPPARRPTWRAA